MLAFRYADASVLAPFSYTQLLWVSILGFLIFGEVPDIWTVTGAAFIVASGLYTAHRERVQALAAAGGAGRAVAQRLIFAGEFSLATWSRAFRRRRRGSDAGTARLRVSCAKASGAKRIRHRKHGGRRCALRFSGTARSSSITLPEPKPGAGQVLVKSLACGICGSDLHARKHAHRMVELAKHFPGRKPMDLARDVVFGHEFCCEVLDYGPGTERKLKPGTKVCSLPALLTAQGPQGIGYSNDNVGAYAERMLLSEALLLEVPNGLGGRTRRA